MALRRRSHDHGPRPRQDSLLVPIRNTTWGGEAGGITQQRRLRRHGVRNVTFIDTPATRRSPPARRGAEATDIVVLVVDATTASCPRHRGAQHARRLGPDRRPSTSSTASRPTPTRHSAALRAGACAQRGGDTEMVQCRPPGTWHDDLLSPAFLTPRRDLASCLRARPGLVPSQKPRIGRGPSPRSGQAGTLRA